MLTALQNKFTPNPSIPYWKEGSYMIGGIYSDERCPICGGVFVDNHINALICPNHPKITARSLKVKFGSLCKRFLSYEDAAFQLTGWRFKKKEKSFDERDYKKDNPLGFTSLMNQYWTDKTTESTNRVGKIERKIKPGTIKNYRYYKSVTCAYFKDRNIKDIAEDVGSIEDFFNSLTDVGNKTKWNYRSFLNDFFTWVWRRNKKAFSRAGVEKPELPEISFVLGYRKLVSKPTQIDIVEEVRRITTFNPKIYLGIKWLCTYIRVRPKEMNALKEGEINLDTGHLLFPDPKENAWKAVPLVQEDIEIIKEIRKKWPAVSSMPFFRHVGGYNNRVKADAPFGEGYLYEWWKKACKNLSIEGVDMYGGTRHSSVTALKGKYSPERIKRSGTGHKSDSIDRYLEMDDEDSLALYVDAVPRKAEVIKIDPALTLGKNG